MPGRLLPGAMCVQRFDDSLNSAIHITYRISLRSSSMPEPRDPLLKVLIIEAVSDGPLIQVWFGVLRRAPPSRGATAPPGAARRSNVTGKFTLVWESFNSVMIPPLVHQRRPCYDFYFL